MNDLQDIRGVEALEECIKVWRLNRTSPILRRGRGRVQGPDGCFRTMGYDDGRRWYTDECRDMTLADMRQSGLKALAMDLPKVGHGSANLFFCGLFWDLHYWDEASRKRFVDVVHEMWAGR